jgi:hypothetical protein
MTSLLTRLLLSTALCAVLLSGSANAQAQGRGRGGFGPLSQLSLAQLEEVQKELQLTSSQS